MDFSTTIPREEWDTDQTYQDKVSSMKRMSKSAAAWFAASRYLGDYGDVSMQDIHDLAMSATLFPESAVGAVPELAEAPNRHHMYRMLVDPYVSSRAAADMVVSTANAMSDVSQMYSDAFRQLSSRGGMTPGDVADSYGGGSSPAFNDSLHDFYKRSV